MMVLAYPFGWRGGFVLMSVLGAVWLWGFHSRYKDSPQSDPAVNAAETALILEGRKDAGNPAPLSWKTMLRSPTLWCLSVMYLCSNAGWSFFASWITPYCVTIFTCQASGWFSLLERRSFSAEPLVSWEVFLPTGRYDSGDRAGDALCKV